jgi:glycosyltransferase involved in cell wall biosynthesis
VLQVSILLPVYNGDAYLEEAIRSALSQSFANFELLIGDDASSDSSGKIIEQYANGDARVVSWRNETNVGLFANYNECLKRATGKYIKPFAQDDLLERDALKNMVAALEKDPGIALVSCARRLIDIDGNSTQVSREYKGDKVFDSDAVLRESLLKVKNGIGEPSAVMFPRSLAGDGFDVSYYHLGDIEYWFRIVHGNKYFYLDEPLCSFRQHKGSTTSKNAKGLKFAVDMINLGKKYSAFLEREGIGAEAYSRLVAQACATHVKFLFRHGQISLSDLLAVGDSTDSRGSDLAAFKELLFYSLLISAETLEEDFALKQEWQSERISLEDTIARLINSRSWKATVPLRGVNKLIGSIRESVP